MTQNRMKTQINDNQEPKTKQQAKKIMGPVTTMKVSPCSLAPSPTTASFITAPPTCRLQVGPTNARFTSFKVLAAFTTMTRGTIAVMASSYIKATGPDSVSDDEAESDDELEQALDDLFLDSRDYNVLMKRMKLKVPKNVRLRNKKLIHRRIRRKKSGRGSKANKLKNKDD